MPPITPETPGSVDAPNDLTESAAGSPSTPNDLTESAAGSPSVPANLTEEAAGSVSTPSDLTEEAAGSIAVPVNLTESAAGSVAAPNDLTEVAAAGYPRAHAPLMKLDFEDGLYSVNGQPIDLMDVMTYSRASNASYVDSYRDHKGTLKTIIREDWVGSVTNLITYSEDFTQSSWNLSGATVARSNIKDPFDGDRAFLFSEDSGNTAHSIYTDPALTIDDKCFSIYAKFAGGHLNLNYRGGVSPSGYAVFDLLSGKIHEATGTELDHAFIEHVGDGWYRCGVRLNHSNSYGFEVNLVPDDFSSFVSYQGDGESGVYIFGAQATDTERTTPYIPTSGFTVAKTFVESPRFEVDPATGEKLGMVNEAGKTNLTLNSEDFSGLSGATETKRASISPDGTNIASGITLTNASSTHYFFKQGAVTSGNEYTFSVFLKAGIYSWVQLTGSVDYQNFNLLTGEIGASNTDLKPTIQYFGDGWYRLSFTITSTTTGQRSFLVVGLESDISFRAPTFVGDNSAPAYYAFGAQIESGNYPTSYIRTEGATVARASDDGSFSNKFFVNPLSKSSDIAIHAKIKASSWSMGSDYGEDIFYFSAAGGLNANRFRVEKYTDDRPYIIYGGQAFITSAGVNISENTNTLTVSVGADKIVRVFLDGVLVATFTTTKDENPILGGQVVLGFSAISQHSKEFIVFDKALTADEIKLL